MNKRITTPNIFEYGSSRDFVSDLIEWRRYKNSMYSMRSFCKCCDISASSLSDYLSGQNFISINNAIKIMSGVDLEGKQIDYFFLLIAYERAEDQESKDKIYEQIKVLRDLADTGFAADVRALFNTLEIAKEYRYRIDGTMIFRVLSLLRDKKSKKKVSHFLDHFFSSDFQTAATGYFIKSKDGSFKSYLEKGFYKESSLESFSDINQNLKVNFNKDGLPEVESMIFSVLQSKQIIEGSLKFSRDLCLLSGVKKSLLSRNKKKENIEYVYKRIFV